MSGKSLVRLSRNIEQGHADGYVVGLSERWLLLLLVGDGVVYSGFQAFRLQDISAIAVPSPRAQFYQAVLRKRKLRRPATPKVELTNTARLLSSAALCFPLVTIHREIADPEVCHIGLVQSVNRTFVALLEITPDAAWESASTKYRLAEITRVDFGGPYEEALALVSEPANAIVEGTLRDKAARRPSLPR